MANASRDENNVTTLLAISSADGETLVEVWADPITHALLTEEVGGSVPNFAIGEVPSGSGTSFTLAHTPLTGTVALYRGGSRQQGGMGNDYTISGSSITFAVTVSAGEILLADYQY